jgi:hypothetical protein
MRIRASRASLLCGLSSVFLGALGLPVLAADTSGENANKTLLQQSLPVCPDLILTDVKIGSRQCLLIVDTGAGVSVLDPSLKNLAPNRVLEPGPFGSDIPLYECAVIAAQALQAPRPWVRFIDMADGSRIVGKHIDGYLGVPELSVGKFFLDMEKRSLEIHTGEWRLKGEDVKEMTLDRTQSRPQYFADVGGDVCDLFIDTGSDGTIELESSDFELLAKRGIIEISPNSTEAHTAQGVKRQKTGWFLSGELMGKPLRGITVVSGDVSGIGMQFLCAFNLEIDLNAHVLRYQKLADAKRPLWIFQMIGATLTYGRDGAHIEDVDYRASAAGHAGISAGDTILKFGPCARSEINRYSVSEIVTANAGKTIAVEYARKTDGSHVVTTLNLPPPISLWNFAGRDDSAQLKK